MTCTCTTCGGTGRYLTTRNTKGGEVVEKYTECPECGVWSIGHLHRTLDEEDADMGEDRMVRGWGE